jgi:hypothetical protein
MGGSNAFRRNPNSGEIPTCVGTGCRRFWWDEADASTRPTFFYILFQKTEKKGTWLKRPASTHILSGVSPDVRLNRRAFRRNPKSGETPEVLVGRSVRFVQRIFSYFIPKNRKKGTWLKRPASTHATVYLEYHSLHKVRCVVFRLSIGWLSFVVL